jgi:hypothetical protein
VKWWRIRLPDSVSRFTKNAYFARKTGRDYLEDLDIDGRILFKGILKEV